MIDLLNVTLWPISNIAIYLTFEEVRRNKSNLLILATLFIGLASAFGGLYIDLNS